METVTSQQRRTTTPPSPSLGLQLGHNGTQDVHPSSTILIPITRTRSTPPSAISVKDCNHMQMSAVAKHITKASLEVRPRQKPSERTLRHS